MGWIIFLILWLFPALLCIVGMLRGAAAVLGDDAPTLLMIIIPLLNMVVTALVLFELYEKSKKKGTQC